MRLTTAVMLVGSILFALIFGSLVPAPYASAETLLQDNTTPTVTLQSPGPQDGVLLGSVPRLDGYTIYFTEANGEASRFDRSDFGLSRLTGLLQRLGASLMTLNWNQDIPQDADMLFIAGPIDNFSPEQSARLWSYIKRGGRVLLLADPLVVEFDDGRLEAEINRALRIDNEFFQLTWADLGLRARDEIVVIGGEPETIQPFPDAPSEGEPTPTPLPMVESIPLSLDFTTSDLSAEHPITADIDGALAFFGARPIEFDSSIQLFDTHALAFSTDNTYGESDYPLYLRRGIAEYNVGEDLAQGPQALIAAVEDEFEGTRIVLVGDGDFVTNGSGFQTSPPSTAGFVHPNNVRFVLNAIAWLVEAGDAERVEFTIPTPGPTATMTPTPTPTPYLSPTPMPENEDGDEG